MIWIQKVPGFSILEVSGSWIQGLRNWELGLEGLGFRL